MSITPQEVIEKSGNSFHIKVADYIEQQWWTVEISPYYTDFVTNTPREVDIIAYKVINIIPYGTHRNEAFEVRVQLFIECKFIKSDDIIIAWTQPINQDRIEKYLSQERIMKPLAWKYTEDYQITTEAKKIHHYFQYQSVAKLFGNSSQHDPMFQWINQVLHSLIYFEKNPVSWICEYTYSYPIILVNSFNNFYKKTKEEDVEKITGNFLFSTSYSYREKEVTKNRDFFIDIIDFKNWLDTFLQKANNELQRYEQKLKMHSPRQYDVVSIDYSNVL